MGFSAQCLLTSDHGPLFHGSLRKPRPPSMQPWSWSHESLKRGRGIRQWLRTDYKFAAVMLWSIKTFIPLGWRWASERKSMILQSDIRWDREIPIFQHREGATQVLMNHGSWRSMSTEKASMTQELLTWFDKMYGSLTLGSANECVSSIIW